MRAYKGADNQRFRNSTYGWSEDLEVVFWSIDTAGERPSIESQGLAYPSVPRTDGHSWTRTQRSGAVPLRKLCRTQGSIYLSQKVLQWATS